ncbi:YcgL domain-containing protein [Halopseudomonas yangmingensis]|uniref:YcgL domain-containing protein SAMN05216217_11159 n=1 Tax=Halopseudomonas yangmingensis TaxID=1720063 RepID=A0A1I4SSZ7_9GAMM|nr:YcgL domain-containing protein [Halopseudomonas yangmingensis]SFM67616.1 hypothetical protein SAMN05216217_11159 [Halopseudomonas yangmingensis]
MKLLCSVYRSPRKDGMYLYVPRQQGLKGLPEVLLAHFGKPVHVMDMPLSAETRLAHEAPAKVLEELRERGFYLQMPPPEDEYIEHLPEQLLYLNDPL